MGHFDEGSPGLEEGDGFFGRRNGSGTDDWKAVLGIFSAETDFGNTRCHDAVETGHQAEIQDARHLFLRVPGGDSEKDGAVFLVAEPEIQHFVQKRGPVGQVVQGREAALAVDVDDEIVRKVVQQGILPDQGALGFLFFIALCAEFHGGDDGGCSGLKTRCNGLYGRFAGNDAGKAEADAVTFIEQVHLPFQHGREAQGMPEMDAKDIPLQSRVFPPVSQADPQLITRNVTLPEHPTGALLETVHPIVPLIIQI